MFNDTALLSRTNPATTSAAERFYAEMEAFSEVVGARTFDDKGLSQGMPFIWKALDPEVAPYYLTV